MNESDLGRIESLIYPLTVREFLGDIWPGTFRHFSGNAARLTELIDLPDFQNIEALARCARRGIIRADYTREDRPSEVEIEAQRAVQLYAAGCTIYITNLASEPLRRWTRSLDAVLGLLPATAQINAFASRPGRGLSWHWDSQESFIVQVRGRKLWHVAPNEDLEWPTSSGQAGAEHRAEIRYQLKNPHKPVERPKRWESIELVPGSVLFMPRGYWHTTDNIDESVHLVLQVKMPCWRDVFLFLLQSVPDLYSLEWRRPTTALKPERLFDAGIEEFKARCAALSSFATPQGVAALAKLFGEAHAGAPKNPSGPY